MFTTCPECGTVFRVTTAQLRMAEGYVRCGYCAAEFNAIASLSDELPTSAAPLPAASGWTARYPAPTGTFPAPMPAGAVTPQPAGAAPEPDDDGAAGRDGWPGSGGAPATGLDQVAGPADGPGPGPDAGDAAGDHDDTLGAGLDAAPRAAADGDDDEPGGVYVIEGETPEWAARSAVEEPLLARAVASVFGRPAELPRDARAAARPRDAAASDTDDATGAAAVADMDGASRDAGEDAPADATATIPATDADVDWEALLVEVAEDEPAAPVYVVEGDAPAIAFAPVDPAADAAELDAALAAMQAEVTDAARRAAALPGDDGPADSPTADARTDAADGSASFPMLRVPPGFRRDLAASFPAPDAGTTGDADPLDPIPAPADPPGVIDADAAGPAGLLAGDQRPPTAAWPAVDPARLPGDPPPELRPAEQPAGVAALPPLWEDRPAWPPAAAQPARRSWPWAVGSLVLALALGAQVLVEQRDELATHPEYGPQVRAACEALGLSVYPTWNLSAYTVRGSEAVAGHTTPGALDVIANIAVTGNEPVGLPIVRVTLRDRWNEAIGARAFSARDYLDLASTLRDPLPPGTLIPVRVRIADPGTAASGYEVDVCIMDRRAGLICQAGREPFRP